MAGSTISSEVTMSVTVAAGFYPSPLAVTPLGSVEPTVGSLNGAVGVVSSISGGAVLNQGTITGGDGAAVLFGRAGDGGIGVDLAGSSLTNSGQVNGGNGGYAAHPGVGGSGGAGVALSAGSTVTNTGTIMGGGSGYERGIGGEFFSGGGAGVVATNSSVTNDGAITGGFGQAAVGVDLLSSALTNIGTIAGGQIFTSLYGSDGVDITNSTVSNKGTIIGGYIGVVLASGGYISNAASAVISGMVGVYSTGSGTVVNAGTIISGAQYRQVGSFINGSVAVSFNGTGPGLLIVDPGAVFVGSVIEAGSSGMLELASATSTGTITGIGGSFTGFGTIMVDPGATWVADGSITGSGTLELGAGSDLLLENGVAAASPVRFTANTGTLGLADPADLGPAVLGLQPGDSIDFTSITSSGSITAGTDASNHLTLTSNGIMLGEIKLDPTQSFSGDAFHASPDGAGGTAVTETPLCFLAGTMIATPSGELPIERLGVGDLVVTARGDVRPIVWIGTGRVLATRNRRGAATPVVVRQGALADNVPYRDLRMTRAHALSFDGALIPVEFLVNHRSIHWDDMAQEVLLYHIELETHGVVLANGAPAESYRDDGNRWLFHNANTGWHLPPKRPCAPVLTGGHLVDAVWWRLLVRAGGRPGVPLTRDADLHLLVDCHRVDASARSGAFHVFNLTRTPDLARIASRAAVPQELGLARDPRCLGVALRRVLVRQGRRWRAIAADDPRLVSGFHAYEAGNGFRWTDGDAVLPAALFAGFHGPLELVLQCGGSTQYVDNGLKCRAA